MTTAMFTKRILLHIFGLILVAVLFLYHLSTGQIHIPFTTVLTSLFEHTETIETLVVQEIRLPRSLLAILVGASLALAGAAMQGLLRNPLAGPGLLGVSSCAALGAVIVIYHGYFSQSWFTLPAGGIIGALLSVALIFFLAGKSASLLHLILCGVAVNAVASSFVALALNFADNPYAMSEMVYWLLGSIANRSQIHVYIALPFMIVGALMVFSSGRYLDALSLGEDTAQSLGFSINKNRWMVVIGVALLVGSAVAVSGNIGFVGLVVPHLLRPLVGYQPSALLSLSAIGGAILLLLTDITVQVVSPGQELKLGVITALIGGPFFLFLIYRMRHDLV